MAKTKRKGDHLTEDQKRKAIDETIYFFEKEREEEIGVIAAEQVLNFFLETVGPSLYNNGVQDVKAALQNRLDELNYDLDDLINI